MQGCKAATVTFLIIPIEEENMKKHFLVVLLLSFSLAAKAGFAEVPTWNLDKAHSNFYFSVQHIFSKVNGHFADYSGTIKFDPNNLAESKILFEIEVDSINTHNSKRDKHLLSEDFFNEAEFETMKFESKEITAAGNNVFNIEGTFTVKGKEYDLTLPLTFAGVKDHPMMKNTKVAGFNGTLSIDRLKYGVGGGKFFDAGVVGKDVDILVSLEVLNNT